MPDSKKVNAIPATNIFIRHQLLSAMPLPVFYTKWEIAQVMMDEGSVLIWPCATDVPSGRDDYIREWISHSSQKIKARPIARTAPRLYIVNP
jgi:hypothetical protein